MSAAEEELRPDAVSVHVSDADEQSGASTPAPASPTAKTGPVVVERDPPGVTKGCCSSKKMPPAKQSSFVATEPETTLALKKVALIYNPFSGGKKGSAIADRICKIFGAADVEVVRTATEHAGHATELMRDKDFSDVDAVVLVGGDGTLHEGVNGVFNRPQGYESFPPLGLVPGGTGNSVMTDLDQLDIEAACKQILKGQVRRIDVGRVCSGGPKMDQHTTYFINLISWGIGVESNVFAEKLRWMGPVRYDVGILVKIMQLPTNFLRIEIDGEVIEGEFNVVTITNNQYGGSGLRLSPYAKIDDGLLDLTIARKSSRGELLGLFSELKREGAHVYHPDAQYLMGKKISFITKEPSIVTIDGEAGGPMHVTPLSVECLARSLKFLN